MSNTNIIKEIFVENWSSVFNTILGKDISINTKSIDKMAKNELPGIIGEFTSFITISYGSGQEEKIIYASKNKVISIVSNLMIGLDSFKDEISPDDKDAFVEAINQMLSACQVPLAEKTGLKMKFTDIAFTEPSDLVGIIKASEVKVWDFEIDIPGISKEGFLLITPDDFGAGTADAQAADVSDFVAEPSPSEPRRQVSYDGSNMDLLLDVELPITIRIGSTEMKLIDIMRLGLGSIIELEKLVDDPVEVLVNDRMVAKGEVVVYDSNFAVRIIDVESRETRIKSLG